MENNQINTLTEFSWDSKIDDTSNFFDFSSEPEKPKEVKPEVIKEDKEDVETEVIPDPKVEDTDKDKEDPFADFKSDEDEGEDKKPDTSKSNTSKDKGTQSKSTTLEKFNMFKDEGIFRHVDLDEDEEDIDENRFKDLLNEEYESEVSSRLETWASEELDDDAKAFIAFKQKGGNTQDFFAKAKEFNVLEGNIEDENFQKNVIREQLSLDDWDNEEINDRLNSLEESGKLSSTAEKYYNRLKTRAQKERDTLIKNQERSKELQEKNKREFKTNLKDTLNSIKEVKGIRINTREKNTLFNFITNEDQTMGNRKVTGFQKSIAEAVQDENKIILLAKLLNSDFDLSDLEKQIKTKEVNKLKENLESRKDLRPNSSSNSSSSGKSLGEIFSQF